MAPINIDGSSISGITIDGENVQKVTVDDDTVWSNSKAASIVYTGTQYGPAVVEDENFTKVHYLDGRGVGVNSLALNNNYVGYAIGYTTEDYSYDVYFDGIPEDSTDPNGYTEREQTISTGQSNGSMSLSSNYLGLQSSGNVEIYSTSNMNEYDYIYEFEEGFFVSINDSYCVSTIRNTNDSYVRVYDLSDGSKIHNINVGNQEPYQSAVNNSYFAYGSQSQEENIFVRNISDGSLEYTFTDKEYRAETLVMSDKYIAYELGNASYDDNRLRVRNLSDGSIEYTLMREDLPILSAGISKSWIVYGGEEGDLHIHNTSDGSHEKTIYGDDQNGVPIYNIAVNPNA